MRPGIPPRSNPPNLHPYNKLPSASSPSGAPLSAGAGGTSNSSAPPSAGSTAGAGTASLGNPAKSPETRTGAPLPSSSTSTPGSTNTSLGNGRGGYGLDPRRAEAKYGLSPINRSAQAEPSPSAHNPQLPHHHHHHHHHHVHPPTSSSSVPGSTTREGERDRASPFPPAPTPNPPPAATTQQPAAPKPVSPLVRFSGYGLFGPLTQSEIRDRKAQRDRDYERQLELQKQHTAQQQAKAKAEAEKLAAAAIPSPFARPSQPPSPTATRTQPGSSASVAAPSNVSSAANTPSAKPPSVSPKMSTASTTGRPNLPLPAYGSLGARSLPSPFERDRPTSASTDSSNTPQHNRTLSGSSSRGDMSTLPGIGQTSPGKPAARQTSAFHRAVFGNPPPLDVHRERSTDPARSPTSASPSTAPKPTTAAQSTSTNPGTAGQRSGYSSYSSYVPPYMGFSTGFGGYGGFGGNWIDRERNRHAEREKEREAAKAKERERERERERQEKEREEKEKARRAALNPPNPPPSTTTMPNRGLYYGGFGRAPVPAPAQPAAPRIEVLNTPAEPAASDSVMQQVAPSREPRPYTYTAKIEPTAAQTAAANAAAQKEREYHYTPRDKRPRMDAAVDEARRGSANKSKRRKEEDKKSPSIQQPRDYSSLTKEVRRWPEVSSAAVESWLKSEPELAGVIGHETYLGGEWTLAHSKSSGSNCEGGVAMVRFNGAYLGNGWVVRGEKGWDDASPYPGDEVEIGSDREKRRIWGTDVYTDDSHLGLVLIHAGWIRWAREEAVKGEGDNDYIEVTVRIVPRLVRYTATERNGVRTRAWGNGHDGRSVVVEGVQRVHVSRKALKEKVNRKLRLAELARQRIVVYGQLPLSEDGRVLNGVEKGLTFGRDGAGMKYDAEDLSGYLDVPDLDSDEVTYALWTHDLLLDGESDQYELSLLSSSEVGSPKLHLVQSPATYQKKADQTVLAEDTSPSQVMFTLDGLVVRTEGEKGVLCAVERYRWRKRAEALVKGVKRDEGVEERQVKSDSGNGRGEAREAKLVRNARGEMVEGGLMWDDNVGIRW